MPASRLPNRAVEPPSRARVFWPIILIGAGLLGAIVASLPASVVGHFLPAAVSAEDFSGDLWHGSAGKIRFGTRDAGALEWRLHPAALLRLAAAAQLHWVKSGFVIDAAAHVDRQGFDLRDVKGGGPIQDLADLGVAAGWRGNAQVNVDELKGDFNRPLAAVGAVRVSNVSSLQIAGGADLGGYLVNLGENAVDTDGNITANLTDTGGPLELKTLVHVSPRERIGTLTGSIQERDGASADLRSQVDGLAQLRGRDPQGRIPLDVEFHF